MKNICVIGTGYVGIVNGTGFADLGNKVVTVDIDQRKVDMLKAGHMPIYEPGLKEMVERNVKAGRLHFTTSYEEGLKDAQFVFICVGTPEGVDGEADLRYVRTAAETIARTMTHPLIIINKSTVPVGTGDWVADIVRKTQPKPVQFSVVSCPEFLREGAAVADFMHPDRTVLGSLDPRASEAVAQLYLPLRAPIVMTDLRTAEMIKYASNAFLATRISFINEISIICEKLGADVTEVAQGMGFDKRIGHHFLQAGVGYGGSCFEGDETIFTVNDDGSVTTRTLKELFDAQDDMTTHANVDIVSTSGVRVMAFDMQTGCPEIADVLTATRRAYNGEMVNIKATMGRTLRVTADHPVIRFSETGFDVIEAGRVQAGDRIVTLKQMPPLSPAPEVIDLIAALDGTALSADVYVSPTDDSFSAQYERYKAHITPDMLKYPHEIKRHNRMPLKLFCYLRDLGVIDVAADKLQLYTAKGAATKINAVIPVDADLMRLLGYYIAEGFISSDTGRAGAQRQRIGFCFHEGEREYIADLQRILTGYGLKYTERHATSATTTLVSSRVFAWFIRDVLGCGTRSEDKQLPNIAFNVDESLRYALLRGMFSGDGAVTTVQGNNLMLEYATVSKKLADATLLLLQSVGITPSVRARMMNKSTMPAYIIRISGYRQIEFAKSLFGETRQAQISAGLGRYQRIIKQHGFEDYGSFDVLTVKAVESSAVEIDVYSLETSLHTFVGSGALCNHNCFPKDVAALAYMAQTHGMHPQLLHAVMEINEFQRRHVALKLDDLLEGDLKGKTIAVLGLAFKENTDDIRESPALAIIRHLLEQGASVRGYDPVAMENACAEIPAITACDDPYDAAQGADALVIATPWNEFKQLDMERIKNALKTPVLLDGRNIYEPDKMLEMGFTYRGVGRGYDGEGVTVIPPGD